MRGGVSRVDRRSSHVCVCVCCKEVGVCVKRLACTFRAATRRGRLLKKNIIAVPPLDSRVCETVVQHV